MSQITIRHFDMRLFLTIDLSLLFQRLAAEWPDAKRLVIEEMTADERTTAALVDNGIVMVRERIHIFAPNGERMVDLEKFIQE